MRKLDDSIGKARLQPFNHIYLPTFDVFDNATVREPFASPYSTPTRRREPDVAGPPPSPPEAPPAQTDWSQDAYLLRTVAALEMLSNVSDMSAAMRSGVLEGLAEAETDDSLEAQLASLGLDEKRSTSWEERARAACGRVGIVPSQAFERDWARLDDLAPR